MFRWYSIPSNRKWKLFLRYNHSNTWSNAYHAPTISLNSNFAFGNINIYQIIMLYTLSLHSVLCQIYLNKAGNIIPISATWVWCSCIVPECSGLSNYRPFMWECISVDSCVLSFLHPGYTLLLTKIFTCWRLCLHWEYSRPDS